MGNVLAVIPPMAGLVGPVIPSMVGLVALGLSLHFRRPNIENPTLAGIQARYLIEQALRDTEQVARNAQARAEHAERECEQVRVRQQEAERRSARAEEETRRAQLEAAEAAERVGKLDEKATKAAREEAERFAREAMEECHRSQKIREDAEKELAAANEQLRRAEAGRAQLACTAADEIKKAVKAKEDAEMRLNEGIQPLVTPSPEEVAATKQRIQYKEDCIHIAIAGISGSGKSSLVNSFRGLRSRDAGAAAVGVTETTLQMTRCPDVHLENPFVWYDMPGAGTLNCRDWQYFNDQGLYVFDCIIVLFDNRFTMTDIAILGNARRFGIPTYIVRSKADQHIQNIMREEGYESEGDVERRDKLYEVARKQFIEKTRESVRANLKSASLPDQPVYIISNTTMLSIVLKETPKKKIDEGGLLNDLLNQVYLRRISPSDEAIPHL